MEAQIGLVSVSKDYSEEGHFSWKANATIERGDILVRIKILGQTILFDSDEIFFTDNGNQLISVTEFCQRHQCDKAQALAAHVKSVGVLVKDKKLRPVLSSVKVIDF